ncbi:MAG: hypothetical protein HY528_01000 [Chloroflexi bacterium]|nr:hypothetical protein [Chloroflexota bacterium]
MVDVSLTLEEKASHLAKQLFGNNSKKCASFTNSLLDICARVQGRDFLLIHNPGGFGSMSFDHLLEWERSVVEGVDATIEQLGYRLVLIQHFRTDNTWWAHISEVKEQIRFSSKGIYPKAIVLIAELKFVVQHFSNLKIILIGASQGAAFSNAVMRQLGECPRVYSIELGIFFAHKPRRVITARTLVIDSNGVTPDPVSHRNLRAIVGAYLIAPLRWIKYWLQGKRQRITYCLNAPGHNYDWDYFEVQRQIKDFLNLNFGTKVTGR